VLRVTESRFLSYSALRGAREIRYGFAMQTFRQIACASLVALIATASLQAWDLTGHRLVNRLALEALPPEFPSFVREPATAERIQFLAGEPDRWRNIGDLPLKHYNGIDHYLDLEELADAGLDLATLPSLRYEFAVKFAAGRAAHPDKFSPIDPAKNSDHSREWPGFAPWAIAEYYGKLKSAFSYLRAFEENGTPDEVANAQANIVYLMGVMGHYVGDLAQPLHTTYRHNGWVKNNPKGYTTWNGLHAWIDGGFLDKVGVDTKGLLSRMKPADLVPTSPRADGRDPIFVAMLDFVQAGNARVEPLYALEQAGGFKTDGTGHPDQGRAFLEAQFQVGGQMLASVWVTAWRNAGPDVFLRTMLLKRKGMPAPVPGK
jgi:hypothetical protein